MNNDPFTQTSFQRNELVNLDDLNPPQREAVTTTEGPVLVIAGAGSGKTRTLVYRVAYLVTQGVPPESILLLSFTRKASQEMLWRAGRLLNENCSRVVGGTFHSVANMLLRRYGARLGFGSSFTIIDRLDAEGIINLLKSSLGLGKKGEKFPTKRAIINIISGSINQSVALEELIQEQYSHLLEHLDDIRNLRRHYEEFKFDHGLMDYDDLLVNWKRLLEEHPDICEVISRRFSYIMVDEYQDTNPVQADIVRLLGHSHGNVMVVGDDSQSIYSFRGADFYNIMRFPKVFADTKVIKLEENYRSTQPILSLTNNIIENAVEKYAKTLFTSIEGDELPKVYAGSGEREEAVFIVKKIRKFLDDGIDPREIAVLFRSSFHSYKLELELGAEAIDYEKRGGLKLTESAHMKDMIAFMRVLVNPQDTLSWNRVLLQLERVGPATAQKISSAVAAADDFLKALQDYQPGSTWKAGFQNLVQLFTELASDSHAPGAIYEITLKYYQPVFERIYHDDFPKRQKDLDQLKALMEGYDDLRAFIDDTTLDPPEENTADANGASRIVLSTIHSAKGLEFDVVFIIGLADGRFPHQAAMFGEQREEERRLLYVAATRARKFLYLTYPRQVMTPDRQFRRTGMSPFLCEIANGLYERVDDQENVCSFGHDQVPFAAAAKRYVSPVRNKKMKKLHMSDLAVGTRVSHPFFGEGVVKRTTGKRSLDIRFDRHGIKTLHLDYAKLTIL